MLMLALGSANQIKCSMTNQSEIFTSYRPPQFNMPQQSVSPFWALQGAKVKYSLIQIESMVCEYYVMLIHVMLIRFSNPGYIKNLSFNAVPPLFKKRLVVTSSFYLTTSHKLKTNSSNLMTSGHLNKRQRMICQQK